MFPARLSSVATPHDGLVAPQTDTLMHKSFFQKEGIRMVVVPVLLFGASAVDSGIVDELKHKYFGDDK